MAPKPGITFTKMQGNGNDFIILDNRNRKLSPDDLRKAAVSLCRRRLSIGADGLMALEPGDSGHFRMRLFNRDGSEGEMCGNGARCLARYAFERDIAPSPMTIETLAGPIIAEVTPPEATLDMGSVTATSILRGEVFPWGDEEEIYSQLTVGVPHTVVFLKPGDERTREDLAPLAMAIQADAERFPQGTNVNFLRVSGKNSLELFTWERGVNDYTLSCGTGSTAGALAAWIENLVEQPVEVKNPGGVNTVLIEPRDDGFNLFLRGRTTFVAEGTVLRDAS
ncbi:MAG: diaminopimelate epimerase [Synergistota bacterium]|nr:diaminopimelate epimerase [Synergistota bacterium]